MPVNKARRTEISNLIFHAIKDRVRSNTSEVVAALIEHTTYMLAALHKIPFDPSAMKDISEKGFEAMVERCEHFAAQHTEGK